MNKLSRLAIGISMAALLAACGGSSGPSGETSKALALSGMVSSLAGSAPNGIDGTGLAAQFNYPTAVTTDGPNVYVADSYNNTIRKVVIATGAVTTLAGTNGTKGTADGTGAAARFYDPQGITTDGTNLYVTDSGNNTIRQVVIATGAVTTLAGTAGAPRSGDGTGAAAGFNYPADITIYGGSLYVTDAGNATIRRLVLATGAVTTLAGTAGKAGSTDGAGAAARFADPEGIVTDGTNLYVADSGNNTIRQVVIATGAVTTLAGDPSTQTATDGTGAAAGFVYPTGMAISGSNLYVGDSGNNAIRQVAIATGTVTTLVGGAGVSGSGNAAVVQLTRPNGIAMSGGSLFVADSGSNSIRQVVIATKAVTALAGSDAGLPGSIDGTGSKAKFYVPNGIASDGVNLYVADTGNSTVRKIVIATGAVTTLAGSASLQGSADGTGSAARFYSPYGVATDGTNIYLADTGNNMIRKLVIATGVVTKLAGNDMAPGFADGIGAAAGFSRPQGLAIVGASLYVVDSGNNTVRKVVIATGAVTTLAGSASTFGSADGTGSAAQFISPAGISTDGTNLFVADSWNSTIRKIVIATGAVTTLAGNPFATGAADGTGAAARFDTPQGVATDGTNLYVTDSGNNTIRKVVIATGAVTTLVGSPGTAGVANGGGTTAQFNNPTGIASDGTSLYVVDSNNNTIRIIR